MISHSEPPVTMFVAHEVQPRAQLALKSSPFYELRELQVEPGHGSLVISGSVSSFYYKQLAQEAVRSVCREIDVVNSICVK
ncbi:MAG: BON domain-containing protein [Patescibacteria group bacterium]|nr:BON domain-containing protein [Patescibacteria group bacterium]